MQLNIEDAMKKSTSRPYAGAYFNGHLYELSLNVG